ncbi:hypothetical protein BaRGS_00004737 [Batillaria attramentaria]|uniref:Glucokinase regulatory protein n=1 Tax=Batillaria attramentaria TaxID=370345 RepID=A0ABD0LWJ2_9CAEN
MASEGKGREQPVTEQANPLSSSIDIMSPLEMVSTLQACDAEIFDGWQDFPGMFDERIQKNLDRLVDIANPSESTVIFSGCGTSGRLGFITARTFNSWLREQGVKECYHSIMAGGDKALFTSQEAVEDDPVLGARLLQEAAEGKSHVLFFGITCGLSAPFVAGQLDLCLQHLDRFTPVLVGFNPAHMARNMPIANWNKTFLQVIKDLEAAEAKGQGFLLNPVVGPEQITGSSRMKSGTATKLLLESVLLPAHGKSFHQVSLSLREGGHLYYYSAGSGSLGIMGLIDASECPPTYGASLDDVRGFLEGGFSTLGNSDGDLSHLGPHFQISTDDFTKHMVASLSAKDLVIFLCKEQVCDVDQRIMGSGCRIACVVVSTSQTPSPPGDQDKFHVVVQLDLSSVSQCPVISGTGLWKWAALLYSELAVKWTLNAVSTGAHILKGKVFNNTMIDLKPSNVKLFHRAVGIIQRYSNLPVEQCRDYLLRALYSTDTLTEDIQNSPLAQHIKIGASKLRVVPTALLAALLKRPIAEAEKILQQQPITRQAVLASLNQQ